MKSNKAKVKERRWPKSEKRIPEETNANWDIWERKVKFMAETKSNIKKHYISDDYTGANGWNKIWEGSRGIGECRECRLCGEQRETVENLLAGWKVLASRKYLISHNRKLMILAISLANKFNLVEKE